MSDGLCQCGCGELAPVAKYTSVRWKMAKGEPMRFIQGHNFHALRQYTPDDSLPKCSHPSCNAPAIDGFKRCVRCRERERIRDRENRALKPKKQKPPGICSNGRCSRPTDGDFKQCPECRARTKKHRLANPDRARANQQRAYAKRDRNARDRANAITRRWYERNKDRSREYSKRRRERSPEAVKQQGLESQRRRRLGYDREAIAYSEILRRDPCVYCGSDGGTIDHITPVDLGGPNSWDNLAGACVRCNARKNATPLLLALLRLNA